MMNAVDTNILIYSADSDETVKGPIAVALLDRLVFEADSTVIPWQVLCEFGAFLSKRRAKPQNASADPLEFARAIVERFPIMLPTEDVYPLAMDIHAKEQVSYWDSLIIAACVSKRIDRLYSEDVQSRPVIRGVQIINTFVSH